MSSDESLDKLAASADEAEPDTGAAEKQGSDEKQTAAQRPAGGPDRDGVVQLEPPRIRREGGARHTVTDSVTLRDGSRCLEGWALNISRGGLRAVLEETVEIGQEYQLVIGNEGESQAVRVVWVREERGGCIVGVSFLARPFASAPPPPSSEAPLLPQLDLEAQRKTKKDPSPGKES